MTFEITKGLSRNTRLEKLYEAGDSYSNDRYFFGLLCEIEFRCAQTVPNFALDCAPWSVLPMVTLRPEELKAFRKRLGLTQTGLAKALGVQRVTVARWESGLRKTPSLLPLALKGLSSQLRRGKKK